MRRRSRRRFLQGSLALASFGLLSGCGLLPPRAEQPGRVARIGWLSLGSRETRAESLATFEQGLREHGYVAGENLAIEYRFAEDKYQFPELVAELLSLRVEVLVSSDANALNAARLASATLPIVMVGINDPVERGFVASLERPGGNITGLAGLSRRLGGKRLEMLKAAFPALARVAVLLDPAHPLSVDARASLPVVARPLGLELLFLEIRTPDDFIYAFEAAGEAYAEAVMPEAQPLFQGHVRRLVNLATLNLLPAIYPAREYPSAGGLMSYGQDYADLIRRAGGYVARILGGAAPAELPVGQPEAFELVINLQTARVMGLTIPQSVLLQATEIIQ